VEAGAESVVAWLPAGRVFRVPGWTPVDASSSTTKLPSPVGDPAPVLLLPGGVVAVGADVGANTTAAARAAPLTIAAALPRPGVDAVPLRCGRACSNDGAACGDLYLDGGDDTPGVKKGRVLSIDADTRSVRFSWPGDGACERVDWPKLERVVVLGGEDGGSKPTRARVKHRGGGAHRASVEPLDGGFAAALDRGGVQLKCPDEVEVEFE
jgi:hypothetical protein